MKKLFSILSVCLSFFFITSTAFATVALPTFNVNGMLNTTIDKFTFENAFVSKINYLDFTSTSTALPDESLIGAIVTLTAERTGDYTFTNGMLTVQDGGFTYLEAELMDIEFITDGTSWYVNPMLNQNDESTMNLRIITTNVDLGHPSRFIEELDSSLLFSNKAGFKLITSLTGPSDITGDSHGSITTFITSGPLRVVPEPSTILLLTSGLIVVGLRRRKN